MQSIHLTLSVEEVKVLIHISQNQLFRIKFIDPKMPGYKARPGEVEAAERAVETLEAALKASKPTVDDGGWSVPIRRVAHRHAR